jgi:hypothetical protein
MDGQLYESDINQFMWYLGNKQIVLIRKFFTRNSLQCAEVPAVTEKLEIAL